VTAVERAGVRMLTFPALTEAGVVCAISTKPVNVRDETERYRFILAAGLRPQSTVTMLQTHRSHVARVDDDDPPSRPPAVDGLVTSRPGRALFGRAADCSLVVVADPEHRALGVAHAGWKGSARGIIVNLIKAMHEHYGTRPSVCLAGIGPTISQAHYPVGPEVPVAFLRNRPWASDYVKAVGGQFHFDLAGVNRRFLIECGIPDDAIDVCELCTHASPDVLHSFRRDGMGAGHQGLVAAWADG